MSSKLITCAVAAFCSVMTAVVVSLAGPLDPPSGPVASTYKTLAEVEPRIAINAINTPGDADSVFKITQPGSYYLTSNITGEAGKHGIEIVASGVSIDLCGFDLSGNPESLDGVGVTVVGLMNISVANGSIRQWGGSGVNLSTSATANCRVDGVLSAFNAGVGIHAEDGCVLTHCSASGNGGAGILAGRSCTIADCSAYNNVGSGIVIGESGVVTECTACLNSGVGISASDGSTIASCTTGRNWQHGIACASRCIVRENSCLKNGTVGDAAGIYALSTNRIEANNCAGNDWGVLVVGSGNFIARNTCSGNTTNWDVAASNALGPIVQAGTNSSHVTGNTYGGSLGSTDPNANFTN